MSANPVDSDALQAANEALTTAALALHRACEELPMDELPATVSRGLRASRDFATVTLGTVLFLLEGDDESLGTIDPRIIDPRRSDG